MREVVNCRCVEIGDEFYPFEKMFESHRNMRKVMDDMMIKLLDKLIEMEGHVSYVILPCSF